MRLLCFLLFLGSSYADPRVVNSAARDVSSCTRICASSSSIDPSAMIRSRSLGNKERVFCSLILAGGLGNLFDRITRGYVVDFIDITFNPYVFNLADCFVTLGIIFLLFDSFFVHKSDAE